MWVRRRQFPVGQGCFHVGSIGLGAPTGGENTLNYVCDCGSTDRAALSAAIQVYAATSQRLQALFVSHLDDDHVSGLDHLLAKVSVESVYIPYVDNVFALIDLLEAEAKGAISASLIEATLEPESWFGRRGIAKVIRVTPGGGAPPDGLSGVIDSMPDAGRVILKESLPAKSLKKGKGEMRAELLELAGGTVLAAMTEGLRLDWMLYPYVDPAPVENRRAFAKAVKNALGISSVKLLSADRIARALRDRQERANLRRCYEQIAPGGARWAHNLVSMSLYSGPATAQPRMRWHRSVASDYFAHWIFEAPFPQAVGWVGTGDAVLSRDSIRAEWLKAFGPLGKKVSTLLLPHHGSRHSFHSELLDIAGLTLCVASAGDPSPYGHPHPIVVDEIRSRRRDFALVTQRSGLTEFIKRLS